MCCQDTFSHVGCAASCGQDTSLSQSRGHMRDSLFCPAANIANLSQKHTGALRFYSLSPAIKRLHFRIVQISEDIITKYLIQIPATLLSQWINSSWKKFYPKVGIFKLCIFMKTDLKCWPVPLTKHWSCTVVEALLTFTDINVCTNDTLQMFH